MLKKIAFLSSMGALLMTFAPAAAFAQSAPLKSIYVEDINKSVDPCDNFFDYANGAWRAANPIPASMSKWSRRWQAGEQNKDSLKIILDDVSQKLDWPKGSVEQLIGDYYGACMNETRVNQLGIKPLEPMLKQIDAIHSQADVQKMIRRLADLSIAVAQHPA